MEDREPRSLPELLAQLDERGITDHRRHEAVHDFMERKARATNTPLSVTFELTPLCNLDCKMCFVHLTDEQMGDAEPLTVAQWRDIMAQALDKGLMYATLTGGECLAYPGFWDLYAFLHDHGAEVSVMTNGLLLDDEAVARFARALPARIQVTLYGASEEAYERVTGRRAFARAMGNVRRAFAAGLPLGVSITPNGFMEDGEELVRLVAGEGIPLFINDGLAAPRPETRRGLAEASLDAYVALARLQRELTKPAGGPERASAADPTGASGRGAEWLADPAGAPGRPPAVDPAHICEPGPKPACGVRCGAGRSCCSVDWRGGMRPCSTFPCEPEDVRAIGFAEAWRRTNRRALAFPNPAECAGCSYGDVCDRCVSEHAAGADVGHANPAICAWAHRMVAEGLL